ncbi:NAD(P)-dependent alcohol dehydrogenase [Nonomuraea cavernae]|uniref:NADPH:quinone reductase n=1 Tax=Nonomuraea cavernae TaxID=2045107 RepID=A0A917ZE71_9ACTN|nr:NAD(P)-dependent alcohol dehydrogenase [Nonomuraea cavernae]MCA2189528.1 NAD(P)-dependent alcohol dehydrogenase [Nonomuraea cavernae]GGO81710.1 NADPH:quinone reductase [Nonomuraea cavernae]
MKAIIQDRYGSPDVLRLEDIDRPIPGDDQVLVEVYAAGVEQGVAHLMTGLPYLLRLGFGLRAPRHRVRGRELAGRVEAVGKNVTRFRPGDEVFGMGEGTFAAYACARERKLARKPANLTFEQAAAVTISATTALLGIHDIGQVKPGQQVLVTGAGGGVGTFALQLAKAAGAEVTGVCGPAKAELVRSIGADHVIDYTREDFTRGGRRYDVIFDLAGNRPVARLRRALTPRGTLVLGGGEDGGRWLGGMERSLGAILLSPFVGQRLRWLLAGERSEDLERLRELAEAGTITPVIGGTYPLSEAPDALRQLAAGQARGKLVITVRE